MFADLIPDVNHSNKQTLVQQTLVFSVHLKKNTVQMIEALCLFVPLTRQ